MALVINKEINNNEESRVELPTYYNDEHDPIKLDLKSRTFSPFKDYIVAVVNDCNSQKITFRVPPEYDGIDLYGTKCNLVWETSWKDDNGNVSKGILEDMVPTYYQDGIEVDWESVITKKEDFIEYTWYLNKYQTAKSGDCSFLLMFTLDPNEETKPKEGEEDYDKKLARWKLEEGYSLSSTAGKFPIKDPGVDISLGEGETLVIDGIPYDKIKELIDKIDNFEDLEGLEEIENKLDKQPGNGSYSQAYVVNAAGEQIMLELSYDGNSDNTIPRRLTGNERGQINVPLVPTGAMHAASKTYVDSMSHNEAEQAKDYVKGYVDAKVKALEQAIPVAESTGGASTITHKSEEEKKNNINGIYSAAFGGCNESNDEAAYSLIGGYENKIDGTGKNALFGLRNLSTTDTAFAANRYNVVSALASFALGERNQVSAQNAGALGNRLVATKKGQVVVGKLNAPNDNALFIVGNGTTNRQNAMTVLEDGTITLGGHFEDDNIVPNQDAPKYNYKSVSGNHTDTLYRVADIPCEPDYTNDWLVGKTLSTTLYGDITITEDMIYADDENWKDARENYLVIYNSTLLMCVVDSIIPTTMDVSELGLYVNPIVTNVPYKKWIDEVISFEMPKPAANIENNVLILS